MTAAVTQPKGGVIMYRTILVPLDGSPFSERALPMALSFARPLGSRLILTRAAAATTFPGADATDAQVEAVREARDYLAGVVASLSGEGVEVEIAVPYGDPAEQILMEIDLHSADLVVMCTHGRTGLGRWIYGSVAEQVLHRSPVPVVLVHPTGETEMLAPSPALARTAFLVLLDGSPFAETVLPHAADLARALDGTILLLRVVEPPLPTYAFAEASMTPPPVATTYAEAESYVAGVAQRLTEPGLTVQTEVAEGWPADIIAQRSETLGHGMVVMATHGRSGVARLLLGSVALQVVRRSAVPVMLVRPSMPAAAAG
jgi:nucleotide-binding universal stress UspA family protein